MCFFYTFSTFAQIIFRGCSFTWSFDRVMRSKSMKMVSVARIIRHELCMIDAFFNFFIQKLFLTKNYFLTADINLTTRGPLYTCLFCMKLGHHKGTKATEPDFWKKSWGVTNWGKSHFGGTFDVFWPYFRIQSLKVSEISYTF